MPSTPSGSPVGDDEIILRHVPEAVATPDVSSGNFQLRHHINEDYISTGRQSIEGANEMLRRLPGAGPGSKVAYAKAGDIRALGLEVRPYAREGNPSHAGIASGAVSLDDELVRMQLASVFKYLPPTEYTPPPQVVPRPAKPKRRR